MTDAEIIQRLPKLDLSNATTTLKVIREAHATMCLVADGDVEAFIVPATEYFDLIQTKRQVLDLIAAGILQEEEA